MKRKNFFNIITLTMLCTAVIIGFNTKKAYAKSNSEWQQRYNPSTADPSSAQGSKTNPVPGKDQTYYRDPIIDVVPWNTYISDIEGHYYDNLSGSVMNDFQSQKVTSYYVLNQKSDGSWEYYDVITVIPGLSVKIISNGVQNENCRKNVKTDHYNWTLPNGDPSGIDKGGSWTTPANSPSSTVIFTKPGKYKIQSVPYQKWDYYIQRSFKLVVVPFYYTPEGSSYQGEIGDTTRYVCSYAFRAKGEGENSSLRKTYNMTIATQDCNKKVTVQDVKTDTQTDADVRLVQ